MVSDLVDFWSLYFDTIIIILVAPAPDRPKKNNNLNGFESNKSKSQQKRKAVLLSAISMTFVPASGSVASIFT